jgi:hypothetical protein
MWTEEQFEKLNAMVPTEGSIAGLANVLDAHDEAVAHWQAATPTKVYHSDEPDCPDTYRNRWARRIAVHKIHAHEHEGFDRLVPFAPGERELPSGGFVRDFIRKLSRDSGRHLAEIKELTPGQAVELRYSLDSTCDREPPVRRGAPPKDPELDAAVLDCVIEDERGRRDFEASAKAFNKKPALVERYGLIDSKTVERIARRVDERIRSIKKTKASGSVRKP